MRIPTCSRRLRPCFELTVLLVVAGTLARSAEPGPATSLRARLDAPLLFVKRHSYTGIHIYDTYYKWGPGGGIFILENPAAPEAERRLRLLVDAARIRDHLGDEGGSPTGVFSDPDVSWDAERVLFCFKGEAQGHTSIWEIGVDGSGLRRLTSPVGCATPSGKFTSHHDVAPAYLPDGRIVFTSTRPNGLVPCFDTGVDVLHVMEADGSGIRAISVNTVNEFDPCVLPDGRILYGRWEYVDKTALTQQSLWTILPDGSDETALFANNLVRPEAFLDARPVPGAPQLIVASMTRHNGPPRGSIGIIDVYRGKNDPRAISNLDRPDAPLHDLGDSCEPWPVSRDLILYSGRPEGSARNVIVLTDGRGRREVVYADPEICCHSPMLVEPRACPPALAVERPPEPTGGVGRFFVQDIYEGLDGVERGEVASLRVIEETSRASGTHGAAYNQTFLVSAALAFSVKRFLGVVPVEPDGSVYFEVPSGRAVYFQALDAEGRLVRSMRTFVQACSGVTRSCTGCHERKFDAAPARSAPRIDAQREPRRLEPESWGSGLLDYPTHVQPILDRRCVRCHGGAEGIAADLDLTGGWTEHFSISYESLVSRRRTQLVADLIAGIDCMNGTALWSARIFPPRSHGSGAAPLARILVEGHDGRIPDLTRPERDLVLAWIDTNGLYHGTWSYSEHGCRVAAWPEVRDALLGVLGEGGCLRCHETGGKTRFESDWFNLERPELSRVLRAPLPEGAEGFGLGLCRDRTVDPQPRRIRMFYEGDYVHHVLPLERFTPRDPVARDASGEAFVSFESTSAPLYRRLLEIIREGRQRALATPRVDMPGAEIIPGRFREPVSVGATP